jgi:hypothetical protein
MDNLPKVPIVNPADKYKEDVERLHEYGTYLITCLPKFIQKFRYLFSSGDYVDRSAYGKTN